MEHPAILPEGFVYLRDIDPSILTSVRYAESNNFVGKPIDGYNAPVIIVTRQTAEALKKVQEKLKHDGYSLLVYDGYRPQRAVNHFKRWSEDIHDQSMKSWFYPNFDKAKAFEQGYISSKSGHSRGSTVDLTIISLQKKPHPIQPIPRKLGDGREILFLDDGSVDMGSSFDLFDEASHIDNDLIGDEHKKNRCYFQNIMLSFGFIPYSKEWWHFTFKDEPFPETYFNFLVE